MTDYIPYTPQEYAVEAPATAAHFGRWFQNWEAGFEGAVGAPRLRIGALQRLNPGAAVRWRMDAEQTGSANADLAAVAFMQSGTVRVACDIKCSNSGTVAVVRRRAGVETVLATYALTTGYVTKATDCPVLPGDAVFLRAALTIGSWFVRNWRFQTAGEDLFPGIESRVEGNTYNA